MAPQIASGGPNGRDCSFDSSSPQCTNSISDSTFPVKQLNIPMLALGLGLAAFLLICLIVCACTYRNAKARNRASRTQTRNLIPQELERGPYIGLGLGLPDRSPAIILKDYDKETRVDEQGPPAYTPKLSLSPAPSTRRSQHPLTLGSSPLLSLTPSPALAAPVSPALSSYTLSPALSQRENEDARLLGGRRPLTPPPPTYVR